MILKPVQHSNFCGFEVELELKFEYNADLAMIFWIFEWWRIDLQKIHVEASWLFLVV